jgi:tetratricopeptide (TPR) repeat protein
MKSFSHALGVRCTECHVSTKPGSNRLEDLDFASDDKQDKKTAREMMRMVSTINTQIDKIGLKDPARVGCVTCHHGVKEPRTLGAVMMKSIEKDGVTGAVDQYRKLRESYYGSAAYDFSADALTEVASDLADSKKDYDGALSLVRLNLEFNPKDVNSYVLMGRLQLAKGDKAGGIASYEKALELDPENRWAKQQLERAKSGE